MKIAGIILILLAPEVCRAQAGIDTTYQVEVTVTASPMVSFFRLPRVPETANKASLGYGVSMRALWHPGRLLSVGIMTGYFVIARDEIHTPDSRYSARLAAIPVQLALSMQKHSLEIGLGIGPYLMVSTIEGGNSEPAQGSRLELGMTFFASYFFPLNDNVRIGPEVRVLHFRYRGILSLMPSLSLHITPLRY